MNFIKLLKLEFMKVKRSKIAPLLFIAPLLVVITGVANLSQYFTPEYTHAWPAMFIQSALVYSYYLLPFSMIVVCVMIAAHESKNNGIMKMLALPLSRTKLSLAKFCVMLFYLAMEMVVFFVVFIIAGLVATSAMGVDETMPVLDLLKWCIDLFVTTVPSVTLMWMITVVFEKPLLSVGFNILLVIPALLVANTALWPIYPYCYSGYYVSCALHSFTANGNSIDFALIPFIPCAVSISALALFIATWRFGKKEMR